MDATGHEPTDSRHEFKTCYPQIAIQLKNFFRHKTFARDKSIVVDVRPMQNLRQKNTRMHRQEKENKQIERY